MSIIEQIKAEIERLKKLVNKGGYYLNNSEQVVGFCTALAEIDTILSTLEAEYASGSSEISNDLDKVAREYANTTFKKPYSDNPDEEVTIVEPDKYAGFIAGAKWDREQMMSEAIKSEVTETCGISSVWIKTKQFKPGQKVHIIIVKED